MRSLMPLAIIIFTVVFWLLLYLLPDPESEAEIARDSYCRMVKIHKESNGEYGWPDYMGSYDNECNEGN